MNQDPGELPLIGDYIRRHAESKAGQLSLVSDEGAISYGRLDKLVDEYAMALYATGIRTGDVVAVLGWSRPECLIAFLATCRVGAVFLGLNPKLLLPELRYIVGDARPRLILSMRSIQEAGHVETLLRLREEFDWLGPIVTRNGKVPGVSISLVDLLARAPETSASALASAAAAVDLHGPAAIVYTSGSTGSPKGALLSQASIVRSALLTWRYWYGSMMPLRTLVQHPISHVAWLVCECVAVLLPGGTLRFCERFSAEGTLRLIEEEQANLWFAFPSEIMLVMDSPRFASSDLRGLERVALGSLASIEVLRRLRSKVDAVMCGSYGLTEASGGAVTATARAADLETVATTVGRVLNGIEVRVEGEAGREVPTGEVGELLIKDRCVFLGYLNRPEDTAAAIDTEGWLHTDDLVRLDEQGNVQLVGRLKEMFKSGGYNIYPTEIENVIISNAAVSAVAVVEAPDDLWGEVGVAFIVPKPGKAPTIDEFRSFVRARLANYKVPKHFVVWEALPQLPNGKFDKVRLRSEARDLVQQAVDGPSTEVGRTGE